MGVASRYAFVSAFFSDGAQKLILDKFHIRVEIVMASGDILMLGLVNLYLAHMRQVYHQLQGRVVKFVGAYRAMCRANGGHLSAKRRTSA